MCWHKLRKTDSVPHLGHCSVDTRALINSEWPRDTEKQEVWGIFKIGSHKLFAQTDFKPWSFRSLPSEYEIYFYRKGLSVFDLSRNWCNFLKENFTTSKIKLEPGVVVQIYNPSYLGDRQEDYKFEASSGKSQWNYLKNKI
jgi:hypothetical protein